MLFNMVFFSYGGFLHLYFLYLVFIPQNKNDQSEF